MNNFYFLQVKITKHSSTKISQKKKDAGLEEAKSFQTCFNRNVVRGQFSASTSLSFDFFAVLLGFFGKRDNNFLSGPWGEFSSHYITFICPSETIRGIDDPTPIMQYWDDAIKHIYYLRGRSLEHGGRRQVVVFDEQPSHGNFF